MELKCSPRPPNHTIIAVGASRERDREGREGGGRKREKGRDGRKGGERKGGEGEGRGIDQNAKFLFQALNLDHSPIRNFLNDVYMPGADTIQWRFAVSWQF